MKNIKPSSFLFLLVLLSLHHNQSHAATIDLVVKHGRKGLRETRGTIFSTNRCRKWISRLTMEQNLNKIWIWNNNWKYLVDIRGGGDSSSQSVDEIIVNNVPEEDQDEKNDDIEDEIISKEIENNDNNEHTQRVEQESKPPERATKGSSSNQRDWISDKVDKFLLSRVYSSSTSGNENTDEDSTSANLKIPSTPLKLLQQIAPKLRPIQRSPDYLLKIRSASPEDAGLAAYAIGVIAGATDLFEKHHRTHRKSNKEGEDSSSSSSDIFVEDMVKNRRWEQIVECVLCGVDVKKRMRELNTLLDTKNNESEHDKSPDRSIENDSSSEEYDIIEGLNVADASRAAWGLAILGVHHYVETLGGETPHDILTALSLRSRDILNTQWEKLSDISSGYSNMAIESSLMDEWDQSQKKIARDASRSMWAFACVKACTGMRSDYLLATCCDILSGNLISEKDLKKRKLEEEDVLDRLAKIVEEDNLDGMEYFKEPETTSSLDTNEVSGSQRKNVTNSESKQDLKNEIPSHSSKSNTSLSNYLKPTDLANVIWSLAVHNNDIYTEDRKNRVRIRKNDIDDQNEYDAKILRLVSNQIQVLLEKDLSHIESREAIISSSSADGNQENSNEFHDKNVNRDSTLSMDEKLGTSFDGTAIENGYNYDEESNSSAINHSNGKSEVNTPVVVTNTDLEEDIVEAIDAAALISGDHTTKRELLHNSSTVKETTIFQEPHSLIAEGLDLSYPITSQQHQVVEVIDAATLLQGDSEPEREMLHLEDYNEIDLEAHSDRGSNTDLEVVDAVSLIMGDENIKKEILRVEVDDELYISDNCKYEKEMETNSKPDDSDGELGSNIKSEPSDNLKNGMVSTSKLESVVSSGPDLRIESDDYNLTKDDDNASNHSSCQDENSDKVTKDDISFPVPPLKLSFASRDLCSIAWAATQLQWRRSSKPIDKESLEEYKKIIPLVVSIVSKTTSDHDDSTESSSTLQEIEFSDLSNLAWAMAKYVNDMRSYRKMTETEQKNILFITRQIAHWSLVWLVENSNKEQIVAPILSRLMWALTTIFRETSGANRPENNFEKLIATLQKLSIVSILEAESNVSLYRAEDLACIVWAYCELSLLSYSSSEAHRINLALGRIQNTIETALLQWELGRTSQVFYESSIWNIPMFERASSSVHLKSLESSRTSAAEEDNLHEDSKMVDSHQNRPGRRLLPSLKSLPIDPSTLCKVSFAYTKLADMSMSVSSTFQLNVGKGAEDLARIAARLFTYGGESLLSQCHPHDIARLCYSYTRSIITAGISITNDDRSMCNSETREALTRHFTKRVVKVINDSIVANATSSTSESLFDVMAPNDLANLIWSLGELGVQCGNNLPADDKFFSRSRRIRLSAKRPILTSDQLQEMSPSSMTNLLHGVVALDDIPNDIDLLECILSDMERYKLLNFSASESCRAVYTVTKLRNFVLDICGTTKFNVENLSEIAHTDNKKEEIESPRNDEIEGVEECIEQATLHKEEAEVEAVIKSLADSDKTWKKASNLLAHCNKVLAALSEKITSEINQLTASQMRKVLQAYHIMPFQADEMVNTIEAEVKLRVSALADMSAASSEGSSSSIQSLIRHSSDRFVDAVSILSELSSKEGNLSSTNNYESVADKSSSKDQSILFTEELSRVKDHMNRAIAAVCEATTRLERIERGAQMSVESSLRSVQNSAAFELGRCQELIDGYRLFEFDSGSHRRRFTGGKKKNVGKRILSRLFQDGK